MVFSHFRSYQYVKSCELYTQTIKYAQCLFHHLPFMTQTCRKETLNTHQYIWGRTPSTSWLVIFFKNRLTKPRHFDSFPYFLQEDSTEKGFVYFGGEFLRKVWCVQIWWIYHSGVSFDLSFKPTFEMTLMLPDATNPSKHHLGQQWHLKRIIIYNDEVSLKLRVQIFTEANGWNMWFHLSMFIFHHLCLICPCNQPSSPLPTSIFYAKPWRKKHLAKPKRKTSKVRWNLDVLLTILLWDRLIGSLLDCTNSMANCFPGLLDLGLMCACGKQAAGR